MITDNETTKTKSNWKLGAASIAFFWIFLPVVLWFRKDPSFYHYVAFQGFLFLSWALGNFALFVYAGFNLRNYLDMLRRLGNRAFWFGLPFSIFLYLIYFWCQNNLHTY